MSLRPASLLLAALLVGSFPAVSSAQLQPGPTDPPAGDSAPGADADPCTAAPGENTADGSLTGQLSECGGVLTPPPMGNTGIEAPVPDTDPGTTPVIPPSTLPDAPGGDDAT